MRQLGTRARLIAGTALLLASGAAGAQTQIGFGAVVPSRAGSATDLNPGYHLQAGTRIPLPVQRFSLVADLTYDQWFINYVFWDQSGHNRAACAFANPTADLGERDPLYFFAGGAFCLNTEAVPDRRAITCAPGATTCVLPPITEHSSAFGYDAGVGAHHDHLFAELRLMHVDSQSPRTWFPIAVGFRF